MSIVGNEEPQYTEIANVQIAEASHKLPELTRLPPCSIPRPFDFGYLMRQWQPMGIRCTLNIPFTGNDRDYLFAIRNGPFIPPMFYQYSDSSTEADYKLTSLDPTTRKLTTLDNYQSYATNNMLNVQHAFNIPQQVDPKGSAVVITQYDQPPILASLATMFRRWRGTMHYRIRVVAGFTTQGYIFITLTRNSQAVTGVYNTATTVAGVQTEDFSYRPGMVNSYIMGDTAMFRHYEFEVPFEYPVPYYDQYNWIGNRSRPANLFMTGKDNTGKSIGERIRSIDNEPHGDNYILVGLRGKIETPQGSSQITFELEYRAGDDFQFADPFLPFDPLYLVPRTNSITNPVSLISIPSSIYNTDGLHGFEPVKPSSRNLETVEIVTDPPRNSFIPGVQSHAQIVQNKMVANNRTGRRPRDLTDYDTVDDSDLESQVGDSPDVLDLKRNLRKSLNR